MLKAVLEPVRVLSTFVLGNSYVVGAHVASIIYNMYHNDDTIICMNAGTLLGKCANGMLLKLKERHLSFDSLHFFIFFPAAIFLAFSSIIYGLSMDSSGAGVAQSVDAILRRFMKNLF